MELNKSVRTICFIKYQENTDISEFEKNNLCGLEYSYILHDKDINENGETKKPHYHIIVKFDTPRKISTCLKRFDIEYLEPVGNELAYLKYMTHENEDDKYKYDKSELILTSYFEKILFKNSQQSLVDVLEIARNSNICNFRDFFLFLNSEYPFLIDECINKAYFINLYLKS